MRVIVIDAIAKEGIAYLNERGFEVEEISSKLPREELLQKIAGSEAIITRSSTTVNAEFLAHARRLRFLGRAGVGVDNIDIDACSRQGVIVANAPYGNVVSAAEHTVGMLLALVRKIPAAHEALKQLSWDRAIYGSELFRKTAGVIGLGKVGSRVATRLRAFDMDVLVYDPYIPESRARELGMRLTDLQTLLTQADIVTVHVPLSDETESMLAAREIALMKPGVRLVNCARGGIVNEGALLAALDSGHVAGAAVDVWTEEPPVSPQVKRPTPRRRRSTWPWTWRDSWPPFATASSSSTRSMCRWATARAWRSRSPSWPSPRSSAASASRSRRTMSSASRWTSPATSRRVIPS
jgi:D-3-phosphoglycerate dehydrogenase